jgi:hypothetical protein
MEKAEFIRPPFAMVSAPMGKIFCFFLSREQHA